MTTFSALPASPDETNAERIVAQLRDDIVRLALKPGDSVSEGETALRFGVSRQPVREALIRLAQMGLVHVQARKATRVNRIAEQAVRDARFIREALEVETVRKAANVCRKSWHPELATLLNKQAIAVAGQDIAAYHALDEAFHRKIAELADVTFVWGLIDTQKAQLDRVRYLTLDSYLEHSLAEHRAIADAIFAGDSAEAEAVLRKHLGKIEDHLRTGRLRYPDYFV
jgi:GntR family transcriptional regulator, rspAB operon transcriptional repressor